MLRAFALASLIAATPALADPDWPDGKGGKACGTCLVGMAVVAGLVDLGFITANVVLAVGGDIMSPFWSVLQGLVGVPHIMVGGLYTGVGLLGAALGVPGAGPFIGSGIILLIIGTYLIVQGIVSIVRYALRKHQERQGRAELEPDLPLPMPVIATAPLPGGALTVLRWSF